MKVAVTCIQLLRDIEQFRTPLEAAGIVLAPAAIAGQHLAGDELIDAVQGCVGVIAGDDKFSRSVLEQCPELKVISKWGIGTDGIDFAAAAALGIAVRNTPAMFAGEVADVTMGYIIMLLRQLHTIDLGVRDGRWPKIVGRSLSSCRLGVIGLGSIGQAVVRRGLAADMEVIGADPSFERRVEVEALGVRTTEIDALCSEADVLSINCPLTPDTFHLMNEERLCLLPRGAYVVNTGRGEVLDTGGLVTQLGAGQIAGAALDVFEEEPLPPDHPLRTFEQVIFGSHNASNTLQASMRTHKAAITNLAQELQVQVQL